MSAFRTIALDDIPAHHEEDTGADWLPLRNALGVLDAPAGTAVFIPDPGAERRAVAEEEGTLILTVGAEPGTAYEVSGWERRLLTAEP